MQNVNMPGELQPFNGSGDSSSITHEPTETLANHSTEQEQPAGALKWKPGDLAPVALSVEHQRGTGEPVRDMGSDRKTSSLSEDVWRLAAGMDVCKRT
jgi:hypothetical protein